MRVNVFCVTKGREDVDGQNILITQSTINIGGQSWPRTYDKFD